MTRQPHVFAGGPLDRASNERRDPAWLAGCLASAESRFLPLRALEVLVDDGPPPALAWVPAAMLDGIDLAGAATLLGLHDGAPRFAIDVSSAAPAVLEALLASGGRFAELRGIAAQLPAGEPAIAAQARSLVDWHARHGFCAVCGAATTAGLGGGTRSCGACGAGHFPRIDPVVIVLVSRGDHALLVHGRGRPGITYTCIAGFMEPGETIEEAVRREVLEEAGVRLAVVRYHSSQPWPFPSSLMIGCHAEAATEAIAIDPEEIDDARWFPRAEVVQALDIAAAATNPGADLPFAVPPPFTISYQLIRAWADTTPTR